MDLILLTVIVFIVTGICGIVWYAANLRSTPPKGCKSNFELWKEDVRDYLSEQGGSYPDNEITAITAYKEGLRPIDYADAILRRHH